MDRTIAQGSTRLCRLVHEWLGARVYSALTM
jgi:hypothetical protein